MTFNNSNWDESKHPRDDIGRFTFKNGVVGLGLDEEPILKGKIEHNENFPNTSNTQKNNKTDYKEDIEKDNKCWEEVFDILKNKAATISRYKDILLNVLDGFLTNAQILYSNTDQLEKLAIKHNLKYEVINVANKFLSIPKNNISDIFRNGSSSNKIKEIKSQLDSNINNNFKPKAMKAAKPDDKYDTSKDINACRMNDKLNFICKPDNPPLNNPITISGVPRGNPMTKEQAGSGNVNPNYNPKSIENNNYAYERNCQSAIVAYEARLRGYDVEASPYEENSLSEDLSHHPHGAWLNPKTKTSCIFTVVNVNNPKNCLNWLKKI